MFSDALPGRRSAEKPPFWLQKGGVYALPILHYTVEAAAEVALAIQKLRPDAIAVELPESLTEIFLRGVARLPEVSVAVASQEEGVPLYYVIEPADALFEALRGALELGVDAFCIDLDVDGYPECRDFFPDSYTITKIGLKKYYELCNASEKELFGERNEWDQKRELYMGKRLKELSFSYDRILFVAGMSHVVRVLEELDRLSYPVFEHVQRSSVSLCALSDRSQREILPQTGWVTAKYEDLRQKFLNSGSEEGFVVDRQQWVYELYKEASFAYVEQTGNVFPGYHMRNLMKFGRNYAAVSEKLIPDFFQILSAAKGCVDHNYAYAVWELATRYPFSCNVDGLPEVDLSVEEVWGSSKRMMFHLKAPRNRPFTQHQRRHDRAQFKFQPPGPFSICSYPKEDLIIENFGHFLRQKGVQIASEEGARTVPFSSSLEDGLDMRETIRRWSERKLYVKMEGKPSRWSGVCCRHF